MSEVRDGARAAKDGTVMRGRRPLLVVALAVSGCASTSPEASFRDVAAMVEQRTGHALYWNRRTPEDARVAAAIGEMVKHDLTLDEAVQIALLNNRTLIATYEELSIGQADLVQAGLLRNPTFRARMTTAEADRLDPNLELGVAWDFLDVLMLPAKRKIAATQLEATKLRVADAVLDVTAETKRAYFELVTAQQVAAMRAVVADAAEASADLTAQQAAAGNASELSLANEQSTLEQFRLDLARARADVVLARERLTRLLGLWGLEARFTVPSRLPELPRDEPPIAHLESTAMARRLDLESLRKEREAIGRTLSLVESSRFTPGLGVAVDVARLDTGHVAVAPGAEVELPLFDQKQALVARMEALFRQADDRLRARAVELRSEVRAAHARAELARSTALQYRTRILPLRERVVALSQQHYDAMLLGVYQLLAAKQSEVNGYREYIETTRDYWIARVDLERAVGVRMASPATPPPEGGTTPPAPRPPGESAPAEHHHPSS
jgi:cobalt-zinc-cadmium efflux system outer membrane protein